MADEILHDADEGMATPDTHDPDETPPWDAPDPDEAATDADDLDAFVQARSPWLDGT
jgi:hypothetical protein